MVRLEEPDSGYAWVVAFAACVINLILSGMSRMIGILYVAIIETYGVSRQEASLPFTVRNAIRYLTGPLVGVLGQRYGIRGVTFFGGLVAAAGSVLCCAAPTVTWISVFWGGMHGLGFSMGNTLFQVTVNQYFEKHRASASGIVLSGACIGSLAFPFLLQSILGTYGLFGCFLILGGIFLNVLPPSLALREPPWVEDPDAYARKKALLKGTALGASATKIHKTTQKENLRKFSQSLRKSPVQEFDVYSLADESNKKAYPNFETTKACKAKFDTPYQNKMEVNVICTSYSALNTIFNKDFNEKEAANVQRKEDQVKSESSKHSIECNSKKTAGGTEHKSSDPNKNILQIVKNIASLYKNPIYLLISLGVATYFWVFIPILTIVVDYSRDKGISQNDSIYLIHALTVGDLVGRLGFGWVTDRSLLTFPVFMTLTFVFQGIFVSLLPLASSFWPYSSLLVLYGVTAGIVFVYFPVLVHKYVDQRDQSIGMGCVGLISGVVTFGIPSLIGYFRDDVGSYDGLLYIVGFVSIITGILWLFEPLFLKLKDQNEE